MKSSLGFEIVCSCRLSSIPSLSAAFVCKFPGTSGITLTLPACCDSKTVLLRSGGDAQLETAPSSSSDKLNVDRYNADKPGKDEEQSEQIGSH
jgi:hypothetical protein